MEDFAGQAVETTALQQGHPAGAAVVGDGALVSTEQDGAVLAGGWLKDVVAAAIRLWEEVQWHVLRDHGHREGLSTRVAAVATVAWLARA